MRIFSDIFGEISSQVLLKFDSLENGFEIADTDLKLRGPGDLMGTQQSGVLDLKIADLGSDGPILQVAREMALKVLDEDPQLGLPQHSALNQKLSDSRKTVTNWSQIS